VALMLAEDERLRLDSLAHRSRTARHLARRARIVLACAEGHDNKAVAKRLRMSQTTVCKWRGRAGKTVTIVWGLPRYAEFLESLARDSKRACGTGGTAIDDGVELQGDLRERVRAVLLHRGYVVKG
jgi:predicted translation initiation factor SUI1